MRTGRKKGSQHAYQMDGVVADVEPHASQEKPKDRRRFRFGKRSV